MFTQMISHAGFRVMLLPMTCRQISCSFVSVLQLLLDVSVRQLDICINYSKLGAVENVSLRIKVEVFISCKKNVRRKNVYRQTEFTLQRNYALALEKTKKTTVLG